MEYTRKELKKGITLHTIKTNKFKTNLIAIFLTTKMKKEIVTENALMSLILRRGTNTMHTQEKISKRLEELYGASCDSGIDKTGDNQILKFYIETINDEYLPQKGENMWKTSIELLTDIVFNPLTEKGMFKEEYFNQEKNTLTQLIKCRKDSKAKYSLDRCIEEMYKGEPYSIYKYGNIEDIEKINNEDLYKNYIKLINESKIDILISGDITEENELMNSIKENNLIQKLQGREPEYNRIEIANKVTEKEKICTESMEVAQGKLVLGLNVNIEKEEDKYAVVVYNALLGGSANSKMFQNVREKAHLAYVAGSNYFKHKNVIFIKVGIEIDNYEKALKLTREQIEDMKQGKFTDKDLQNAKKGIIEAIKTIDDEQDSQITYFFGQELTNQECVLIKEYIEKIEKITKEDVLKVAEKVAVDTIYFLRS